MRTIKWIVLFSLIWFLGSCNKPFPPNPVASTNKSSAKDIQDAIFSIGTGPMVSIRALVYDEQRGTIENEFQIPKGTENLRIGEFQKTITNIKGIDQLDKVKRLALFFIDTRSKMKSEIPNELQEFKNLEVLFISSSSLDTADLSFIRDCPSLRVLILSGTNFYRSDPLDLSALGNLTAIWINGAIFDKQYYSKNGNQVLQNMYYFEWHLPPSLRILYLDSNIYPLTFSDSYLSKLSSVEHFFISKQSFDAGHNAIDLKKYPNVKLVTGEAEIKKNINNMPSGDELVSDWQSWPAIK